jgi:hypothetical protein
MLLQVVKGNDEIHCSILFFELFIGKTEDFILLVRFTAEVILNLSSASGAKLLFWRYNFIV